MQTLQCTHAEGAVFLRQRAVSRPLTTGLAVPSPLTGGLAFSSSLTAGSRVQGARWSLKCGPQTPETRALGQVTAMASGGGVRGASVRSMGVREAPVGSEGGVGRDSVSIVTTQILGGSLKAGACAVALALSLYATASPSLAQALPFSSHILPSDTTISLGSAQTAEAAPPLIVTPDLDTVTQGTQGRLSRGPTASLALATPYTTSEEAQQLGLLDGRIRPCPTALNPNCVSTSSLNRSYAEPWIVPPASLENADRKIETAIVSSQQDSVILKSEDLPSGHYILAEVPGPFGGKDSVEFLIKEADGMVFYRSMAGKVVYVYPFTTPITDFEAQRKRVSSLRDELGWNQVAGACDYGVCSEYEDAEDEDTINKEPRLFPF